MCVYYQLRGMSCRTTVCEAFQGQDIWKKNYYYYSASLGSYSGLKVKLLFYTMSDRLMWTVVHNQSSWLMNPGSWAVIMNVHDLGSHTTGSRPTLSMQSHCWYEFVRMHHHPELFTLPPSLLHHDRNVYAHPGSRSSNGIQDVIIISQNVIFWHNKSMLPLAGTTENPCDDAGRFLTSPAEVSQP